MGIHDSSDYGQGIDGGYVEPSILGNAGEFDAVSLEELDEIIGSMLREIDSHCSGSGMCGSSAGCCSEGRNEDER